jgi:hypothetical protein
MIRLKLLIAERLDRRNPNYCWANLVMWVMGYYSTKEMFFGRWRLVDNQTCEKGNEFCGKCRAKEK